MVIQIDPIDEKDLPMIIEITRSFWRDDMIAIHGEILPVADMQGIKATKDHQTIGILHYRIIGDECEILTLASLHEGQGVGTQLLNAVEAIAHANRCRILSLTTTNDNLHALGFYQRRGFHLTALFPNQVMISRKYKPSIPLIGNDKIPLRDELRLEKNIIEENLTK